MPSLPLYIKRSVYLFTLASNVSGYTSASAFTLVQCAHEIRPAMNGVSGVVVQPVPKKSEK